MEIGCFPKLSQKAIARPGIPMATPDEWNRLSFSVQWQLTILGFRSRQKAGGLGGAVVTHSSPTSDFGSSNPDPYVGKLVLMWERWYLLAHGQQFTVQNLNQLYVLVSSTHKTTRDDMTCTVLKET